MSKIFAVFGATGRQGGAIVDFVLNDAELSKEYKIRAISRDLNSEKAKALAQKIEVVTGDATDEASLKSALAGVHTVFAMTNPAFGPDAYQSEYNAGKAIADAAVAQGVQYIIFSALPSVKDISGGKYTNVTNFDSKADVEKYIRGLPIKSAFYWPGEFMSNWNEFPFYGAERQSDGTYVMYRPNAPSSKSPLVNTGADTGKFIGAILADPAKFEGKVVLGATRYYSLTEIAEHLSKSSGKTVIAKQLPLEEYTKTLPDFIQDVFPEVLKFGEEYSYYGPDGEKDLAESVANARGKLTTFEEYLNEHPFKLE